MNLGVSALGRRQQIYSRIFHIVTLLHVEFNIYCLRYLSDEPISSNSEPPKFSFVSLVL